MPSIVDGKFVIVGEYLGDEMEYVAEDSTKIYEQDGKLYAAITGNLKVNARRRTLNIKPARIPKRPFITRGDLIIGRVDYVRKFTVGVRIFKVNNYFIFDNSNLYGNIHVSNVSKQYIEKIDDAFKKTDIVRAKILRNEGLEYEMVTDSPFLGVILADCPVCGTTLVKKGRDFLECPYCGYESRRKLSNDYGRPRDRINI
ncbi:MAG: exosome complex RNA-binding protein Csl4 [Promethearchaeota archaeon]